MDRVARRRIGPARDPRGSRIVGGSGDGAGRQKGIGGECRDMCRAAVKSYLC